MTTAGDWAVVLQATFVALGAWLVDHGLEVVKLVGVTFAILVAIAVLVALIPDDWDRRDDDPPPPSAFA